MLADLLTPLNAIPLFLLALVVFGLAPGLVLRLVVLAFHRDDPRRDELLAELRAVPRWDRPFWVFEQLEVALVEGLGERIAWALTGRVIRRWHLESGVQFNRDYPATFQIPPAEDKAMLASGDLVKLMFMSHDGWGERMWVKVVKSRRRGHIGVLQNEPIGIARLNWGRRIRFTNDHIIDIVFSEDIDEFHAEGLREIEARKLRMEIDW